MSLLKDNVELAERLRRRRSQPPLVPAAPSRTALDAGAASEGLGLQNETKQVPPGLRVLLVEDEPLIAIDGEDMLRAMGVDDVVCVRTVAEGMAALDANQFHAALLDLRLGQESSIPLAQRLAAHERAVRVPDRLSGQRHSARVQGPPGGRQTVHARRSLATLLSEPDRAARPDKPPHRAAICIGSFANSPWRVRRR